MKNLKYIIISLAVLTACSGEKKSNQKAEEVLLIEENNEVFLTSDQIEAIKIQTGHIEQRNMVDVIKANGYLDVPPQNNAVVSPMITGYVRKINFLVGDDVQKGSVMAELESMEFIDMQQQFIELDAEVLFLKQEYDRQKFLQDNDAVSKKIFQKAKVEYTNKLTSLEGLRAKLVLLGVDFEKLSEGKINPRFVLRAPISGSVNRMNTMIGKFTGPSEEIFEIVNTDHLHLELSVYEQDAGKIKKGQKVWFRTPGQGDAIYEGEIHLVGKDLSQDKRSVNVHVHIFGDESRFTVGMYANATVVINENPSNTLPVAAPVADGGKEYVFKMNASAGDRVSFSKVQVITGLESDGLIELVDTGGLSADDEIVTKGAFYLLNAFSGEE